MKYPLKLLRFAMLIRYVSPGGLFALIPVSGDEWYTEYRQSLTRSRCSEYPGEYIRFLGSRDARCSRWLAMASAIREG